MPARAPGPRPARSLKMPMAVSLSGIARQTESGDRAFACPGSGSGCGSFVLKRAGSRIACRCCSNCQPLASLAGQPPLGAVAQIKDLDSTATCPVASLIAGAIASGVSLSLRMRYRCVMPALAAVAVSRSLRLRDSLAWVLLPKSKIWTAPHHRPAAVIPCRVLWVRVWQLRFEERRFPNCLQVQQ